MPSPFQFIEQLEARRRCRLRFVSEVYAMFQLIKALGAQVVLARQLPVAGVSFVTAAVFYKFHNFALECVAFLVTWFVIDGVFRGSLNLADLKAPESSD